MSEPSDKPSLEARVLGSATTVLFGERNGRYPHGNSVLVRGAEESLLIDPSLGIVAREGTLPGVDRLLLSHCHEDHVVGCGLFASAPLHVHAFDRQGMLSLDGLMTIYGFPPEIEMPFRRIVVDQFHYAPRPDAIAYDDGAVFDLGGGVRVRAIHAPGHTRGHCLLHVEPDDVLFTGDIDLSSFGPYYGDAWSDLEAFEASIRLVRGMKARHYVTFHHIGVVDGSDAFIERLDRYAAVISDRERRLLTWLAEPRTLTEISRHRFVYRPQDPVPFAEPVEARSMSMHLARLVRAGRVCEIEPGRWRVAV